MGMQLNKKRKVEILAPAGSFMGLKAAINASCDGVYIGGSRFSARAFAENLEEEKMLQAIDLVHLHEKKIYLTVNTLLKDKEIEETLFSYLLPYYRQGLDAVIVQDIGAAKFIHDNFPELPIHASTQMTLTDSVGTHLLKKLGITRFVPSRELSLEEIKKMKKETDLEIETFVHGALCYSYSGQCLLSSMIGGRSGNRGRCAQPCRMPYRLKEGNQEGYLLSPKDICTLDLIPELIEVGIDSFKIEGRMKRPEYTALCTYVYGKYTDLYFEKGREGYTEYIKKNEKEYQQDKKNLMDIYNRGGFSAGYYNCYHGKAQMSMKRPNHHGVLVGEVISVKGNQAAFVLKEEINSQDVLEFRNKKEEGLYEYTVGRKGKARDTIWANFKYGSRISVKNQVYRTKNQSLIERIQETFLKQDKKIPITGEFICEIGKPFSLMLRRNQDEITLSGEEVMPAMNQPLTRQNINSAIDKIEDTKYVFLQLDGKITGDGFLPKSKIKELRREGIRLLEEKILEKHIRKKIVKKEENKVSSFPCFHEQNELIQFHVSVCSEQQLETVLTFLEVRRIYVSDEVQLSKGTIEKAHKAEKEIYRAMPYIFRRKTFDTYEDYNFMNVDGFLIRNFEEAAYLKEKNKSNSIVLDSNMYTFNVYAKDFWYENGVYEYTAPVELNKKEIEKRGTRGDILIVYGHLPLMISAQCLVDNCLQCKKKSEIVHLYDKKKKEFIIKNQCKECYNIIYDGTALSLSEEEEQIKNLRFSALRIDFTIEGEQEVSDVLKKYIDVFRYNKQEIILKNTSKGHFRRGVE